MKPFDLFTKRGQRSRLRKLVLAALEVYDLPVRRVRFLTEHTNIHFRVDTADGRKFAARIYSQDSSLAENEAEMFWLPALADVPGLHVITPVPRRDGRSRPDYPSLCHAFQTGYKQVRPWPVTDPRHMNWLMMARTINFINWVVQIEDEPHEYIQSRCTAVARQLNTLPP